jgi:hypothetical protein
MTVEQGKYLQQPAFSSNVKEFKTSKLVLFGVKIDYFLRNKWNTGMPRMLAMASSNLTVSPSDRVRPSERYTERPTPTLVEGEVPLLKHVHA